MYETPAKNAMQKTPAKNHAIYETSAKNDVYETPAKTGVYDTPGRRLSRLSRKSPVQSTPQPMESSVSPGRGGAGFSRRPLARGSVKQGCASLLEDYYFMLKSTIQEYVII